jgi:organic hydroperoxide reductase OsmC/OhrA
VQQPAQPEGNGVIPVTLLTEHHSACLLMSLVIMLTDNTALQAEYYRIDGDLSIQNR